MALLPIAVLARLPAAPEVAGLLGDDVPAELGVAARVGGLVVHHHGHQRHRKHSAGPVLQCE